MHLDIERVLQIRNVAARAEELDAPHHAFGAHEVFELLLIPLRTTNDTARQGADRLHALAFEPMQRAQQYFLPLPRLHVDRHADENISACHP